MDIVLKGQPQSNQRIYGQSGKFRFMKKKAIELKKDWILQAKEQRPRGILEQKLFMSIKLYHGDKRVRDIDNFSKLILDSLTGIVYMDDSQIYKMEIEKFYDKSYPRVEINFIFYNEMNDVKNSNKNKSG